MKKYFVVHFSGHGDPKLVGTRDNGAFSGFAPLLSLGNVSRFSFYAGLGRESSTQVAKGVYSIINNYNGGNIKDVTFIIHGYSAGGITALDFAYLVPNDQIVYLSLSDAAFYRGESDFLRTFPGSKAYWLNENYYQLKDNSTSNDEIHNTVAGFINYNLTSSIKYFSTTSNHTQAVNMADNKIFDKMKALIKKDL